MNDYPFIKFTIYFIVGILFGNIASPGLILTIILVLILFITLIIFIVRKSNADKMNGIIVQILIVTFIITGGAIFYRLTEYRQTFYPFQQQRVKDLTVEGTIVAKELPKEKYFDFYMSASRLIINDDSVYVNFKLLCKYKRAKKYQELPFDVGDQVSVKGTIQKGREQRNPYEFDYNKYLNSKGVAALLYIKNMNDINRFDSTTFHLSELVYKSRLRIAEFIDELYTKESAALLKGLLLADRSGIDYDTKEAFVNSGVIHVLAVSGLHVGYIALIFLFLFSRFNIYLKNIFTVIGLFLFVLVTGAPPSVVRASIMASILILSNLSVRNYNNLNSLAVAAFLILIFDPSELFHTGFQLSFSAVLSIFILYPIIADYISSLNIKPKLLRGIILFMGVSISAQIGTLPFTLHYFNKLSIVALGVNLFVIPAIGIIVSLGIASLLFGSIFLYAGQCYAFTNELISSMMFKLVELSGSWEYSYLYISQFSLYDGVIFYLFLFMIYISFKFFHTITAKVIATLLILINSYIFFSLDNRQLLPDNLLSVVMIDIGQGDSFLIKFPDGKTALIDAGNASFGFDNGERIIYPLLRNLGIERINYGFVSHMDADHYLGFESLIDHEIVDTIYKPYCDSTISHDVEFEELVKDYDIPVIYYDRNLFRIGGTRLYVLNDMKRNRKMSYNMNDRSGIIKLVYGKNRILFTGDAGKKVESELIRNYGTFLESDLLKAGHHGSKTSTGNEFLNYVKPKAALISAGLFNRFKHPSSEVIDKLNFNEIEIYRTDLEKAVIIHSDGHRFWRDNWRN